MRRPDARRSAERCFVVTASIALLVLISWMSGQWRLGTFGGQYVPMAPSSALLLLALSGAAWMRSARPESMLATVTARALVLGVVGATLFVSTGFLSGSDVALERWLASTRETVGRFPVGRMSPLTAAVFLLASAAFWVGQRRTPRPLCSQVAGILAFGVLATGIGVMIGYALQVPILYDSDVTPMAASTAMAFAWLASGLLFSGAPDAWPLNLFSAPPVTMPPSRRFRRLFVAPAALIVTFIAVTGYYYFKRQQAEIHHAAQDTLSLVADIKARAVRQWYEQQRADVEGVLATFSLDDEVSRFLADPSDAALRQRLLVWMEAHRREHDYAAVVLYDAAGVPLLSAGSRDAGARRDEDGPAMVRRTLRARAIVFEDLQGAGVDTSLQMRFLVPVGAGPRLDRPATGVLVVHIDPRRQLFPTLREWPTPSRTAQALLVRRDGDEIAYLNAPVPGANDSQVVRVPMGSDSRLPAARAVLGQEGVLKGRNLRGVPVVSGLRQVPGTAWAIVANVDQAEIDAPLRRQAVTTTLLVGALMLMVLFGFSSLWYRHDLASAARELALVRQREEMDEKLRESEARYARAVRGSHDGLWDWDLVAGEGYFSPRCKELLGFEDHELPNSEDEFFSRLHPDDAAQVRSAIKAHFESDVPFNRELRLRIKSGEYRWFRARGQVDRDESGRPRHFAGALTDITDRKLAEEARTRVESALKASEENYRRIVETAEEGIWMLDAEARTIFTNPRLRTILGYSWEEMAGRPLFDFMDDAAGAAARTRLELRRQGSAEQYDLCLKRKDGSDVWVIVSANPMFDPNGRFTGTLGMLTDITARKQTESALRKLSIATEQSPVSIIITDVNGTIEYVNPHFSEVSGYTFAEAVGQNPRMLKSGTRPAAEYREMWATLTAGRVWEGEFSNRKKNGDLFWEDAKITPVKDTDGVVTGYLAVKEDITSRKQAEEEREALHAQLLHAQKMESIGRLAGGVAHDFNNMLGTIIGSVELVLEQTSPEHPTYGDIVQIHEAAQRSADLTRQLLAFARRQTISPRVLDLNEAVSRMLKMLQRLIGENIELVWKPGANLWPVKMDPTQVDQILANLSVNARDAISGSGVLTLETANVVLGRNAREQRRPGEYVRLVVQDTGSGMDETTLAHLFEPFFTTKPAGRGTGLGAATVYGVVTQNDGFVDVTSAPGKGTTFSIYVPRALEIADAAETAVSRTSVATGGTETILVVEDDAALLNLSRRLLTRLGYRVLSAQAGTDAIAIAEQHEGPIDLLMTDVIMPGMNGKALHDSIVAARPEVRTLYMSGYSADVIAQRGVLDAGTSFIQKPFTSAGLAAKVRETLDR